MDTLYLGKVHKCGVAKINILCRASILLTPRNQPEMANLVGKKLWRLTPPFGLSIQPTAAFVNLGPGLCIAISAR